MPGLGKKHSLRLAGSSGRGYWERQWYGIQIDESNSSPDVTRIASDMRCHAELPVHKLIKGCLLKDDGTVNYYLNPADWTKKIDGTASNLDGTDGQVVNEWPTFHYKHELVSSGVHNVKLSLSALSGFTLVPKHYVSAYEATINRTANKLASVKNVTTTYRGGDNTSTWDAAVNTLLGMPVSNLGRTTLRTDARARGLGWNMYNYEDHKWLWWFYVIEYATLNSQKAVDASLTIEGYKKGGLGNGVTTAVAAEHNTFSKYNPFIPCGATDILGNGSGEVSVVKADFGGSGVNRTFSACRYRGHENPFGHIRKYIDGINTEIQSIADGGKVNTYISANPCDWGDSYLNYINYGEQPHATGSIKTIAIDDNLNWFSKTVSGTGFNTYYCDQYYMTYPGSTFMSVMAVGGCSISGAQGGLADTNLGAPVNWGHQVSGTRLCYKSNQGFNYNPVYIIEGQSNASGGYTGAPSDTKYNKPKNVFIWNNDNWEQLEYGVNTQGALSTDHGSELSLGYEAIQYYRKPVFIIKNTLGGAGISTFLPGGANYKPTEINTAINALITLGYTPKIVALHWNQGEADSVYGTTYDAYLNDMRSLITDFRSNIVNASTAKFITCRLSQELAGTTCDPGFLEIRRAQEAISQDAGCYYYNEDDLPFNLGIHFDSDGQIIIGDRVFNLSI